MSHAEAFGHLRSFVVGLEVKAQDLRKVLESSRSEDGKWINGKDGTGIGERCTRAIGAASPEQVTKDMIAEVAEQDKLMRQVEDTMRTEHPIQEATEKYQALVEYNQLALEDLEERLSAYGYVRPARVRLDEKGAVDPPAVSSVARLPARTRAAGKSSKKNVDKGDGNSGGARGGGDDGVVAAGSDAPAECREREETVAPNGSSAFPQQQEEEGGEDRSDGLEAETREAAAEASACAGSGIGSGEHNHGGGGHSAATGAAERGIAVEDETAPGVQEEGGACGGVVTPARPALVVREEPEDEPGSPPTPASPGLADWEITEGTREMLRRAQPQHHHQQQQQPQQQQPTREATGAVAPRSLEALLAENTAVSAAGTDPAGAAGGGHGRRSSASSNWSPPPPPSTTNAGLSRSGSSGRQRRRGVLDGHGGGDGGIVGVGTPTKGACADRAAEEAGTAATAVTGAGGSMSAWGTSSNPPTPARMGFEEGPPWTPGGQVPAVAEAGDRKSSLGSPGLSFRSPLKSDETAHLVETAMSCGKQLNASTTSEKDSSGSAMSPPKPTPIKRSSLQGDEVSLEGSLPKKGPGGDFWGGASPASSVVASSQEATGELPAPMSPETPATPKALSPRFRIEGGSGRGADGGGGGGATAAGTPGRVTRSSSRKMALTSDGAGRGGGLVNDSINGDLDNGNSSGSSHGEDLDGYDSEKCRTPELSSPLRFASISARDLQVLTPSASRARADDGDDGGGGSNTGAGSYRRDGGLDDQRGDSGDDSDTCPTPELSSPLRSAGSAALCRRRLEEADGVGDDEATASGGPLVLVSEEEYAKAPKFLTIQVSRSLLNGTIENLNAYAAPRLGSPSELLLTVEEIMAIIDQGDLSRTLLLSAAHLKRIEMKGPRMYRIRA